MPLRRRFMYGVAAALIVLGGFGATASPYGRVGPGPVVQVGRPAAGTWSVTTVRVRRDSRLRWVVAVLSGERVVRTGGTTAPVMAWSMATSQTYAALVAAQLADGRTPVGSAGVQVTGVTGAARATRLRPGDVLLAAGDGPTLTPLRAPDDVRAAAPRSGAVQVLVAPRTSATSWGRARVEQIPAAGLTAARVSATVSALTYPLGAVQGPSAGLMLALARLDELTGGHLNGGLRIAGTGAIGPDGKVTNVGEVVLKVHAAVAAHADVFLVPCGQLAVALRADRHSRMRIVAVSSVAEAAARLCTTGGHSPTCP